MMRTAKAPKSKAGKATRTVLYSAYTFILLLYIFSSPPFICISTLICAAAHEGCHILCASMLGRRIKPLSFSLTGLYPDVGTGGSVSCIAIYASGPLVNIAACAVCIVIYRYHPSGAVIDLFSVNAVLGCFNLLPVPFTDGDGILRIILPRILHGRALAAVCTVIEVLFSFGLFVAFSYGFFILRCGLFSFLCSFVLLISSLGGVRRE